ncbi:RNA polymerase sigma factor [Bythopirellula goksoeyrii]|uniref:RNA polymerase sigma factor n=2 Tax=Bythopirellula goksoeyrii TaxID=1400387 RepID=A0A5B9QI70_9BACT|nr:RNA polymerase sigma factor [Bythopirellula goksoeyrii]
MSAVMSQSPISKDAKLAPTELAQLVREHQADIWRYLRYLGATPSDADDLTQETFLAVARANFIEQSPPQTAAYLRTAARNQLLMARRREKHQINTVELATAEQVWSTLVPDTGTAGLFAALADCLEKLEGRALAVIDGFYRDRRSREELAHEMRMKPDGVKTLLRRTREVLRNCIEKRTES